MLIFAQIALKSNEYISTTGAYSDFNFLSNDENP